MAFPPDGAVGPQGDVGVDRVVADGAHRVGVGARVRAGHHAEKAHLRVDRPQMAVGVHTHPGDIVADSPDPVTLLLETLGRQKHRQIGFAARAGERGGDILDVAVRLLDPQDEHVLGEPFLALGQHAGNAQGQTLLAQQDVAAVATADRPDGVVFGKMQDQPAVDVEVGLAVQALREFTLRAERVQRCFRPCGS